MKVALCVIATGKYACFVEPLLQSANQYFCEGHSVEYLLFADAINLPSLGVTRPIHVIPTEHRPWPEPTLFRYRTMLRAESVLSAFDYVFYVDADMRFVRQVADEMFGELIATRHPWQVLLDRPDAYDRNPQSRACVHPHEGGKYFAGAFQGGAAGRWLRAMREMDNAIEDDWLRGVVAAWHDESHWNRYLIDHPPTVELPHEYCCPGNWRPDTQRIVLLDKDYSRMRT